MEPSRRWNVLSLWMFISVILLSELFIDVDLDRLAMWNVVTVASFLEWPNMALGLVMSDQLLLVPSSSPAMSTIRFSCS